MPQRKILLLENVATQAAGVREHLSQAGFQVAVSRYEADGLKRLVEWGPDLVLVSIAHPAGDFVEYCRRVRTLAPAVRIIVTASLKRDRLFLEHPGLQTIVDGVLLRPYSHEEVAAVLATAPVAPRAPAADPVVDHGDAELRTEFQRQLDARFLEIEELKRHLEVATKRVAAAPGVEWLQSENEHLRQGVEETRKKAALAFATEQLKRSEIEVKLDNLLRMKEDFEFRAQNEINDQNRELELVRGQLQELRESSDKAAGEHAALRVEMERTQVEKEQLEERLHALETGGPVETPPPDAPRIAALEAELSRQRALVAEGQVALADITAQAAVLEELRLREPAAREEREQLQAQVQGLSGQAAAAQRVAAELQAKFDGAQDRLAAAESAAAAAQTGLAAASERRAALEKILADVREARVGDARLAQEHWNEAVAQKQQLLERAESAERRTEQLQSACAELEERQQTFNGEVLAWREKAAAAARELELLRSQQERSAQGQEEERRGSTERLEKAVRELEESERQVAALRGELTATAQAHDRETRLLAERAAAESAAESAAAREQEARLQLEAQQASSRELEEKLAAQAVPEAGASPVQAELHRIQELLEEVISRARTEAVDYARRDAELSVRLQAALDERRLLQERFDRAGAEATERERRSSSLLQSAIDHRPAPTAERANLPAIVPPDPGPGTPRRKPVLVGLAVVTLAVLLAIFGLRRTTPPAVREQQPAVQRPQPGAAPGAAVTPREVWDRWTRSDGAGGVLVQATLRSEQELRAEVEADRAHGMSDEEAQAELVQRLRAFRFDTTYYVTVYLKNLAPGYPAYLDNLPGRFRLRDDNGKEVPAFLPPGHEKDHRIFSFGAGTPGELIYEASVSLGFDRAGLSPSAGYLQLVVADIGAASRRVLTWELE